MSAQRGLVVMAEFSDSRYDARVRRQAEAVAAGGWDVTLIMYRDDAVPGAERIEKGVRLVEIPLPGRYASGRRGGRVARYIRLARAAGAMAWQCMRRRGDVYHAHNFVLGWALWIGASVRRARFVYDAHEISWDEPELHFKIGTVIEGFLLRRADLRLCPAASRAKLIASHYGVPEPMVIGNYPDFTIDGSSNALREALGLDSATPVVYYSGAFSINTRLQEQVIAAMPLMAARPVFVLVGTWHPHERERLEAAAKKAGVADRVHILPPYPHEQLLAFTASADVGVCLLRDAGLAYRYHALNKFYEYVACGLPVVASDLPTFREEVTDGVDGPIGVVCDADDVPQLAAAFDRVLLDPTLRREMARRARARAAAQWNWPREAKRLRAAYDDLRTDGRRAVGLPST